MLRLAHHLPPAAGGALTEGGVVTQLLAVLEHTVAQQALGLRVAGGLHLPSDLRHGVQHPQLSSVCLKTLSLVIP